ncbi:hypothetical protein AB0P12_17625 [Streptomyces subrutilus]|uniref:Uncharacterized protein n=1 Tax=Streptomyces subrutilus TaxID=36818 RepID=A0A5P2UII9_9ACTN|nr:hypothetical protein [Streptomyces subrutilus]QEU78868.1 hypothetical protein CP968_11705 [Streptomyces subrutilus]WSJ31949.1 hypothetical protein OG479_23190 [Streptomyces subrutilus]GGZ83696.1 hypothetical protein GCM10010371_49280 [Streptomyces subrutilus]
MSRTARILTAAAFAALLVGGATGAASADSGWGFAAPAPARSAQPPADSGWGVAPPDSGWGFVRK